MHRNDEGSRSRIDAGYSLFGGIQLTDGCAAVVENAYVLLQYLQVVSATYRFTTVPVS